MDNETERLRDRLRAACGTLPDAAHVTVRVGDLLACIRAIEDAAEADEQLEKAEDANADAYDRGYAAGYEAAEAEAA